MTVSFLENLQSSLFRKTIFLYTAHQSQQQVLKCTCKELHKNISELERYNLSPRRCDTSKSTLS